MFYFAFCTKYRIPLQGIFGQLSPTNRTLNLCEDLQLLKICMNAEEPVLKWVLVEQAAEIMCL